VYIAGNHEYYGKNLRGHLQHMRETAAGTNVLTEFVLGHPCRLWIHGHTHWAFDYKSVKPVSSRIPGDIRTRRLTLQSQADRGSLICQSPKLISAAMTVRSSTSAAWTESRGRRRAWRGPS